MVEKVNVLIGTLKLQSSLSSRYCHLSATEISHEAEPVDNSEKVMEKEEDYFEIFFAITYSQIILMHFGKTRAKYAY